MTVAQLNKETINSDRSPSFLEFILSSYHSCWNYKWAIQSFIANNLSRRYRRSGLGFLWGLVGPLMTMAITATVFSLIFKADPHKYTLYILSGLLPWNFMCDSAVQGSNCFVNAEVYLRKLFIPKIFFPLVVVGTDTVNFLFNLIALLSLGALFGLKLPLACLLLPAAILITAIFNLGIILIYSVATIYFRDLSHILQITYTAFFYSVPIIYPMESLPPQYRIFFKFSPFYWFINLFRHMISDGTLPSKLEWIVPIVLAAVALLIGLFTLRMKDRDIIFRL